MIVSKARLAQLFGVTPSTVGRWVKDGAPVVAAPDGGETRAQWRFDTEAVIEWHRELSQEARKKADAKDLAALKTRKKLAEVAMLQLQLGWRQGVLVHIDDVMDEFDERLQITKSRLTAMPIRLAHTLSEQTDPQICHQVIQAEIDQALAVLDAEATSEAIKRIAKNQGAISRRF